MATISVVKIKVRRGTNSDRQLIVLDSGELGYVTDTESRRLFVGDGSTRGGNPAGIKFYAANVANTLTVATAQVGDIIYNTNDNRLYTLSGYDSSGFPNYANFPGSYQNIGAKTDNSSLEYSAGGFLKIKDLGINSSHLNTSVFDTTNGGIARASSTGNFYVNYDNVTIKVSPSNRSLYVNMNSISLSAINTVNQTINANGLGMSNLPTSSLGLSTGKLWNDNGYVRIIP
jgi:hypothetical protein